MKKNTLLLKILFVVFTQITNSQTNFNDKWFLLSDAMYGAYGYTYGEVPSNFNYKMCNAFSFDPPFDAGMKQVIDDRNAGLFVTCFGSPHHTSGMTNTDMLNLRQSIADYTVNKGADGYKIWWEPMPEWDQGGGGWVPGGRPTYYSLSRQQAYQKFIDYYNNTCEFSAYGLTPADRGGCKIACVTDFPCNTAAAYEMGVDMVFIERTIDELSDISTGIPFVRGLSRQYDKVWGIDVSTWRTSNDAATEFNPDGSLKGGWSPSYLRRIYYVSYMSGANAIQIEPTGYYDGFGNLNPFGLMNKEFGDFCLTRHPNVGRTDVATAFMFDFNNGFDPKHWIWCQSDNVWYQDIPYSDGDFMINNIFKTAWPGHSLHGLCPGAPFADAGGVPDVTGFKTYLSTGGDPRPYEPMCPAQWGSNFDIIYDNANVNTLQQYKTIILVGNVPLTSNLKTRLQQFVNNGGTLVVNAKQVSAADETFIGVTLSANTGTGSQSKWLADNTVLGESNFNYTKVTPVTATVVATNNGSDELITSNVVGNGEVIFTTADYMQSSAKDTLLNVGQKLIGDLVARHSKADVTGPFMVDYIINVDSGKIIVTIVNNTGNSWNGTVSFDKPAGTYTTEEWVQDITLSNSENAGKVNISVNVPAYDLKVIVLNYQVLPTFIADNSFEKNEIKLVVSPNPFNKNASISFQCKNQQDEITLSVFDVAGKKVKTLYKGKPSATEENIYNWDGTNDSGDPVSKGIYVIKLQTQNSVRSEKIVLLR